MLAEWGGGRACQGEWICVAGDGKARTHVISEGEAVASQHHSVALRVYISDIGCIHCQSAPYSPVPDVTAVVPMLAIW